MRTRSRWMLALALAAVAVPSAILVSEASGEPVDTRARVEPTIVRVEIDNLDSIRGLRFVGPIVQSVQPAGAGEKSAAASGGSTPYWTNWNNDTVAISGSLPAPAALSGWLEASFDGRPTARNVSVVAVDTYARELWRWRFTDCAPVQMAYDVDASTWTLRLTFARMRYQGAAVVETDVPAAPRSDERVTLVGATFLKVTLASGSALEALRLEATDTDGQVAVVQRKGGRVTLPWAEIKAVEVGTEVPPPAR